MQQWLAALGYQPGRIDGRPGEETVEAIRDFEMDKGLVPRGRVSAELVARLSEAAAPKPSSRVKPQPAASRPASAVCALRHRPYSGAPCG